MPGKQPVTDLGSFDGVLGLEQNAVVLVGVQRLLAAAFAAETQPTEWHAGVAFFRQGQLDHPADGVVVEQRNDVGDLGGRRAMSKHTFHQLADFTADCHQVVDPGRVADSAGQVHQVHALQREQVTLGHHAAQALVFDQTHMGDMPFGHGDSGVEGTVVRAQEERRLGHMAVNALAEIAGAVGHHLAQVTQGKMPKGALCSSTITMLPTCCSCINVTASRNGVCGLHVTGWRMANSPRRVFREYWVPRVSTAFAALAG